MQSYADFNDHVQSDYEHLRTQYDLDMRIAHTKKKIAKVMRHTFEFGTIKRGGLLLQINIDNPNPASNRGHFRLINIAEKSEIYLHEYLGIGLDSKIASRIKEILAVIFEGFSYGDDNETIAENIKTMLHPPAPKENASHQHYVPSVFSEALLQQVIETSARKGAPLTGFRYSPHGRVVVGYKSKDGETLERYFINVKECVQHLCAAYMLDPIS